MPSRFVILHHRLENSEHWDLMVEYGGALLTWQLPSEPTGPDCLPMPATRIADHRIAYLTYEGPVGGNRGTVRATQKGTVVIAEVAEDFCRFKLNGSLFSGDFQVRRVSGSTWTFELP